MTTTKEATMARLEAQAVAEELRQFIANDYDLYRQQETPIRANLERKVKRGTYNHDKAPKLWLYLVTSGARKYVKEHCSKGDTIRRIFPLKMREELAQKLADDWADELYEAYNRS
tara:strand:- start:352 stop:696 length:345 start_codon:yes stop_codon:yes gene_type:complete